MPNENEVDYSEFDLDFKGEESPTADQNLEPTVPEQQETPPPETEETSQPEPEAETPVQEETPAEEAQPEEEPKPEDDIETLRRQLAEAQGELLNLKQWKVDNEQKKEETPPVQPQPQPQVAAVEKPIQLPGLANQVTSVDFLQGQDYTQILEDGAKFNHLLNVVATVSINTAIAAAQERILRQIPEVVETSAKQQFRIKELVGNFYEKHKDLEPYKPAVSMAAMKLYNDNPNMDISEILNKAADETRKFLRLRPATPVRPRTPAKPVGNGGGGVRPTTTTLSEQEQQILDLLS